MVIGAISGCSPFAVDLDEDVVCVDRAAGGIGGVETDVLVVDGAGSGRPIEEVSEPSGGQVVGLDRRGQIGHGAAPLGWWRVMAR
jgi:hypothetical protein